MLPSGSILLAGLPATGKSYFGGWLEDYHGYFHLDFDEEDIVQQRGFAQEQAALWQHSQPDPLYQALVARQQPIVLTWGFAPRMLPLVNHMLGWGFTPVWFAANPQSARRAFIQRGGIDVKYFDRFLDLITLSQEDLLETFDHHTIYPLQEDGTRMTPEEIYRQVQAWL